jgi:hypothetical protein
MALNRTLQAASNKRKEVSVWPQDYSCFSVLCLVLGKFNAPTCVLKTAGAFKKIS